MTAHVTSKVTVPLLAGNVGMLTPACKAATENVAGQAAPLVAAHVTVVQVSPEEGVSVTTAPFAGRGPRLVTTMVYLVLSPDSNVSFAKSLTPLLGVLVLLMTRLVTASR